MIRARLLENYESDSVCNQGLTFTAAELVEKRS